MVHFGSFWFILQNPLFLFTFVAYRAASILATAIRANGDLRLQKAVLLTFGETEFRHTLLSSETKLVHMSCND